jgi:SAM-dependent methyltransferase
VSRETDSIGRFANRAADYARFRPSYPPAAIDAIFAGLGPPESLSVADIGAGTGISLGLLAARGANAVGVEPGAEMRDEASRAGLDVREGDATATGLATGSFDLVTAFQAFHWFANAASVAEFARILRPGGRIALVWNFFDRSDPFTEAFAGLHERYGDPARIAGLGIDEAGVRKAVREGGFAELRRASFPWTLDADEAALAGRLRSSSSTPREGPRYEAMIEELHALFAQHAKSGGTLPLAYRADVFLSEKIG